jgi:hypothetical protein
MTQSIAGQGAEVLQARERRPFILDSMSMADVSLGEES